MKHLIVDSGSTKSDWVLIDGSDIHEFKTRGLNPNFHDEASVYNTVSENQALSQLGDQITHVFFYGSGCSSSALNSIIENGLGRIFIKAEISVDHDLKACAIATYQGEASISCILGTGSNSCFFNGDNLLQNVPSLGYILGDEGSGAYFGRQLLRDYLYNRLPQSLHAALKNDYDLSKDEILNNVYKKPNANSYLATFMKFIVLHSRDEYIKKMVIDGFMHFIQIHVTGYANYKNVKTHFIGSIAFLFLKELQHACDFYEVNIGQVLQKPIEGLVSYHQNKYQEML